MKNDGRIVSWDDDILSMMGKIKNVPNFQTTNQKYIGNIMNKHCFLHLRISRVTVMTAKTSQVTQKCQPFPCSDNELNLQKEDTHSNQHPRECVLGAFQLVFCLDMTSSNLAMEKIPSFIDAS